MDGSIDILYYLKEIPTVKEKLDENQFIKLRDIRNSVSDEFEKYDKLSETGLNCIDQLLLVNERDNSFNKRRELIARLKFNVIFLAVWRFPIDVLILQSIKYKYTSLSKTTYSNNASSFFQKTCSKS